MSRLPGRPDRRPRAAFSASLRIGFEQGRLLKVGIDVHQHAGQLEGSPQRGWHLHDGLWSPGFGDPRADRLVLLARYQPQAQHLVECLHEGLRGFVLAEVAPTVYNKGAAAAQERLQQRVMELDIGVHEDEFQYWRKYDAHVKTKKR